MSRKVRSVFLSLHMQRAKAHRSACIEACVEARVEACIEACIEARVEACVEALLLTPLVASVLKNYSQRHKFSRYNF